MTAKSYAVSARHLWQIWWNTVVAIPALRSVDGLRVRIIQRFSVARSRANPVDRARSLGEFAKHPTVDQ